MGTPLDNLIGQKITSLEIDKEEQHYLIINTPTGELVLEADGDCCSETWFADIIGVDNLLGKTVTTVEDVEIDDIQDNRTRQEEDEFYCYKIITESGHADIIFRNSSNGYYGGDIITKKTKPEGVQFVTITEDYSA